MNASSEALCPICASRESEEFVRRSGVSVHQNLLCESREAAGRLARGELRMHVCRDCGFVFNAAFDESLLEYGRQYDNTQTHSPAFQEYVDQIVDRLVQRPEVRRGAVVEVGCGKGGFLRRLVEQAGPECAGHGYDPAYVGEEEALEGRLRFHRRYYQPDHAADVVLSRHVIEHIPQPMELLKSVRRTLVGSPHARGPARVCFETPCALWILKNQVVWDLFYEHCSLFTADSLATAFRLAGFQVESVEHVFGGQYLWLEAVLDRDAAPAPAARLSSTCAPEVVALAREFARKEAELIARWRRIVEERARCGGVVVWGGGAKGATFASLVDRDCRWVSAVVDVNPNKQGRFLPGAGHPLVSPQSLASLSIKSAILLNPNYADEVRGQLQELGLNIELIDLMNEPARSDS